MLMNVGLIVSAYKRYQYTKILLPTYSYIDIASSCLRKIYFGVRQLTLVTKAYDKTLVINKTIRLRFCSITSRFCLTSGL